MISVFGIYPKFMTFFIFHPLFTFYEHTVCKTPHSIIFINEQTFNISDRTSLGERIKLSKRSFAKSTQFCCATLNNVNKVIEFTNYISIEIYGTYFPH